MISVLVRIGPATRNVEPEGTACGFNLTECCPKTVTGSIRCLSRFQS